MSGENGKPIYSSRAEDVDLVALLESIVEDARFEAARRDVSIELTYDEPITVEANMQLLYSALENVLRNALRHAPDGSRIDVSLTCDEAIAHVRIRDRGPGVPEAELSALFEPFYTVAPEDGNKAGTGIGLSITRRVIDQLRGQVDVRNAPDGGLQCHIQLPRSPAQVNSEGGQT